MRTEGLQDMCAMCCSTQAGEESLGGAAEPEVSTPQVQKPRSEFEIGDDNTRVLKVL